MICKNCGTELEDGALFCENCGSPVGQEINQEQASSEPVEDTYEEEVAEQVDTEEEPSITFDAPEGDAPAPKSKGKLIALIGLGAIVILAVVLLLNLSAIKAWYVRTVASPEELLSSIYKDGVAEQISEASGSLEIVKQAYGDGNQTMSGEAHVKFGEQILNLLETAVYGGDGDMSWLSDIAIDYELTQSDPYVQAVIGLGLGEHSIISLEAINNSETGQQWIKIPELNDQALTMTSATEMVSVETPYSNVIVNSLPSGEVLSELYSSLMDIILNGFSGVDKKTVTLTSGAVSQEVLVLEAKMSEESMMRALIRLLEYLKQDTEVKVFFDKVNAEYQAMIEENSHILGAIVEDADVYAEFVKAVDAAIAELNAELPNCDTENYLVLYTYINDDNKIAGIQLDVFGSIDNPGTQLYFVNLMNNEQFAVEFVAGDFKLTGEGTSGDSTNSTYKIIADEEVFATFKLIDFKSGVTASSGTMRIEPGAAMMEQLTEGMDSGMVSLLGLSNFALQIDMDTTLESAEMVVAFLANDNNLFSVEYTITLGEAKQIVVPETAVDATDNMASYQWLMNLDVETVMNNLKTAGISEELINALVESIMESALG